MIAEKRELLVSFSRESDDNSASNILNFFENNSRGLTISICDDIDTDTKSDKIKMNEIISSLLSISKATKGRNIEIKKS